MKSKIALAITFCTALVLFVPAFLHAQPGFTDTVDDVPVDGGLSVLVAAGIGYSIKKLKEKRK